MAGPIRAEPEANHGANADSLWTRFAIMDQLPAGLDEGAACAWTDGDFGHRLAHLLG